MNARNESFIVCQSDLTGMWTIRAHATAETVSESCEELKSRLPVVEHAFGSFVRPGRCSITSFGYDIDAALLDIYQQAVADPETVDKQSITDTSGISLEQVRDTLDETCAGTDDSLYRYISELYFNRIAVRLKLAKHDGYVSAADESFCKRSVRGETLDESPNEEILDIGLNHHHAENEHSEKVPVLTLTVRTQTDIWYADNEYGAANRERLVAFFDRFLSNVDPLYVDFHSDTTSQQSLEERGMGELIPDIGSYR